MTLRGDDPPQTPRLLCGRRVLMEKGTVRSGGEPGSLSAHMGQDVVIRETTTMGDVLVIDTDRSFTGQDGHMMTPETEPYGVPGKLAMRLFSLDPGIDYVFVLQNIVTVRRNGGWDEDNASQVTEVAESFLRFYPDEPDSPDEEPENPADEVE